MARGCTPYCRSHAIAKRGLAIAPPPKSEAMPKAEAITVFDRPAVRAHRDRAARCAGDGGFLVREIGERLADRLLDVRRSFPLALDLGCHRGEMRPLLAGRGGIETLVSCDLSPRMAARAGGLTLAADEEWLPFRPRMFDLVISALSLHWINDLPGALIQIRQALRPDGLLLAAMLGGETLKELRQALAEAEIANEAGLSPRVSPFADVRDAGHLLQRAGFALPTVDTETVVVSYPHPFALMADLRAMGEANATRERRKTFSRRNTLHAAAARYAERFAGPDGRVPATFQIIYLTAWAPDESRQPRPLRPGSAHARLAAALGSAEVPSGGRAHHRAQAESK
jgi:NADH dehydrogenase [ubiquinone] 1 alpha subcomplex assembly factor 5